MDSLLAELGIDGRSIGGLMNKEVFLEELASVAASAETASAEPIAAQPGLETALVADVTMQTDKRVKHQQE